MDTNQQLFTIQQVSLRLNIPKHTLRFWEKELGGIIVPFRTQGGQRRYGTDMVSKIDEIRKLRSKGLGLAEIKRKLSVDEMSQDDWQRTKGIDELVDRISEIVRSEVYRLLESE